MQKNIILLILNLLVFISCSKNDTDDSTKTIGYVNLGLPSGTKWKNYNEPGYYTYNDAISQFGEQLPSGYQFSELVQHCTWEWIPSETAYKVTGPNGNFIVLPTTGYRYYENIYELDFSGYYLSSRFLENGAFLYFDYRGASVRTLSTDGGVELFRIKGYTDNLGYSVRLVQD